MEIGASFSTGRVAYSHDMRITHTKNVDMNLSGDNVLLVDNLQGKSIEEYTNERMQPVIDAYNEQQKRKDRRIEIPYCEYFNQQKDHGELCYEAVLQYGEHETLGKRYYEATSEAERQKIKQEYINVYRYMLEVMKKRYPNLEILYAVIHFDEPNGTPHLHICYQGIGKKYKQGLKEQVSIGNALTCCGIERVKNRAEAQALGGYQLTRFYHEIRNKFFVPLLENRLQYTIKEEQHGREHQEPDIFKAKKQAEAEVAQLRAERDLLKEQTEEASREFRKKLDEVSELDNILNASTDNKKREGLSSLREKLLKLIHNRNKIIDNAVREQIASSEPVLAFLKGVRSKTGASLYLELKEQIKPFMIPESMKQTIRNYESSPKSERIIVSSHLKELSLVLSPPCFKKLLESVQKDISAEVRKNYSNYEAEVEEAFKDIVDLVETHCKNNLIDL